MAGVTDRVRRTLAFLSQNIVILAITVVITYIVVPEFQDRRFLREEMFELTTNVARYMARAEDLSHVQDRGIVSSAQIGTIVAALNAASSDVTYGLIYAGKRASFAYRVDLSQQFHLVESAHTAVVNASSALVEAIEAVMPEATAQVPYPTADPMRMAASDDLRIATIELRGAIGRLEAATDALLEHTW